MQTEYAIYLYWTWRLSGEISIRAPWGSGKTIIFLGFLAWVIGIQPSVRIKLVSVTDKLAQERVGTVLQWIEDDDDWKRTFPNVLPDPKRWGTTAIRVRTRDPRTGEIKGLVGATDATLAAYGVTAAGIGGRCDILAMDDICDRRDVDSPEIRKTRRAMVTSVWLGRLDIGGCVMSIATPWHTEDAIAKFTAPEEEEGSEFPTVSYAISEDKTHLDVTYENWPEELGEGFDELPLYTWAEGVEGLKKKEKKLTKREFSRGMELKPIDVMDLKFKREWIVWYDEPLKKLVGFIFAALDPAWGRRESAQEARNRGKDPAYSALIFLLKVAPDLMYIVDYIQTRDDPKAVRKTYVQRWKYYTDKIRFPFWSANQASFEVVGGGQGSLFDDLVKEGKDQQISIPLVEYHPVGPKLERIYTMIPEVEDGRFRFKKGCPRQKNLVDQLTAVPFGTYIDGPDVLHQATSYARNVTVNTKRRPRAGGGRTLGAQIAAEDN